MRTIIFFGVIAMVLNIVVIWLSVFAFSKEAKEKGMSEKDYTIWSVISEVVIGFS